MIDEQLARLIGAIETHRLYIYSSCSAFWLPLAAPSD
jgi:hypothetical protein